MQFPTHTTRMRHLDRTKRSLCSTAAWVLVCVVHACMLAVPTVSFRAPRNVSTRPSWHLQWRTSPDEVESTNIEVAGSRLRHCLTQRSPSHIELEIMKSRRIWVGPYDYAFQPSIMGRHFRAQGFQVSVMTDDAHPFGDFSDQHLNGCDDSCWARIVEAHHVFVVHEFPFSRRWGGLIELRDKGKCVIFNAHGTEFRPVSQFRQVSLGHYNDTTAVIQDMWLARAEGLIQQPWNVAEMAGAALIAHDPEMAGYYNYDVIIPRALNLSEFPFVGVPARADNTVLIIHSPSNRAVKYSDFMAAVVSRLQKELSGRVNIEYKELHQVSHSVVQSYTARADIVLDQLRIGHYGVFAQEAMARGKPVVVYIRHDLRHRVLGPDSEQWPLVPSSAYELEDDLRKLILDRELRHKISHNARKYVEAKHDAARASQAFLQLLYCSCYAAGQ